MIGKRRILSTLLVVCLLSAMLPGWSAAAKPGQGNKPELRISRVAPQKPPRGTPVGDTSSGLVHLKFAEGTDIRLRGQRFVSQAGYDLDAVNDVIKGSSGVKVDRVFHSRSESALQEEKKSLEAKSGREQGDKNLYYRLSPAKKADIQTLVDDLNALDVVEIAYVVPEQTACATPDFSDQQEYAFAAPDGIEADYAHTLPGGTGSEVTITTVEFAWNRNHEDLSKARAPGALLTIPSTTPTYPAGDDRNHGTAVIGVMIADDNGFGVTGLAHDAGFHMVGTRIEVQQNGQAVVQDDAAAAIDVAAASLQAGDVMQMSWGWNYRDANGNLVREMPAESVQACYDAIVAATSAGIIVVESAANGNRNLDADPEFTSRADSQAILVGAGGGVGDGDFDSDSLERCSYSNFGANVDLQGWGEYVVTTGYEFYPLPPPNGFSNTPLQGGTDENLWYADDFAGTSSASPIVASAAAILSSVAQRQGDADGLTSLEARDILRDTGTPQDLGAGQLTGHIGPQPDLRAALMRYLPTAEAGGPYTTPEGTDVVLDGSGSSDPQGQPITYEWDLDNDGAYDDGTGVTPTFDQVGQDGTFTVGLRVTDAGGITATDTAAVNVTNVLPDYSYVGWGGTANEGSATFIYGLFDDPGWLDPLSVLIDWGDGTSTNPGGVVENVRPKASIDFAANHVYGDDGVFIANVTATDDDGTGPSSQPVFTVNNVAPTATIDQSGFIMVNGVPTVIAHAGSPVAFSGRSTDPGSDDLVLSWDWADGAPAPDVSTSYLVNPPGSDPDPSASVQPRDVTDTQSHSFGNACFYQVGFSAADDDGGSASQSANVVMVGNSPYTYSAGYWQKQLRDGRGAAVSLPQLSCYLKIVGYMSSVFDETKDASTIANALQILSNPKAGDIRVSFDQQLLAVWLNFANGAIPYDVMIDATGDGVPDMMFSSFMSYAEALRNDPAAAKTDLEQAKEVLERINFLTMPLYD